jgi:SH3-like domain-containing protein
VIAVLTCAIAGGLFRAVDAARETAGFMQGVGLDRVRIFFVAFLLAVCPLGSVALAQTTGPASGLGLPRFVSLKADKVNVRTGPSRDHDVNWVFTRAGLPVEITAEFGTWRRIRDSEGADGWVHQSLLSGRRTALVAPWAKGETFALYDRADRNSTLAARLQPGVLCTVKACSGDWCRVFGEGFDGFIEQERLWGVYPKEPIE